MSILGVTVIRRVLSRGHVFVILAAAAMAGCEASGPIKAADSMLELRLASDAWPRITREQEIESTNRFEEWDWPNGSLQILRGVRGYYYDNDYTDPEDLIEDIQSWGTTVPASFDRRNVQTDENASGSFQYAVIAHGSRNCFYMLQPIYYNRGARWLPPHSVEYSAGYITFYECARASAMTKDALEKRGLLFARALYRTW